MHPDGRKLLRIARKAVVGSEWEDVCFPKPPTPEEMQIMKQNDARIAALEVLMKKGKR